MQCSSLDNSIADALIAAHDGDVALLYIYLCRRGGGDMEQAARELCRTMNEISAAREKLQRMGLIPGQEGSAALPGPDIRPAPAEELPEYETEDLVRRSREDAGFSAIVAEAQKVLGHVLSSSDLKRLFGIYDYLALPPEVILMLLNHCVFISQGRRPSMRFMQQAAPGGCVQAQGEPGYPRKGADGHGAEVHILLAGHGLRGGLHRHRL